MNVSFIPTFWFAHHLALAACESLFVDYIVAIINIVEHLIAGACFLFYPCSDAKYPCVCVFVFFFLVGRKLYLSVYKDGWKCVFDMA